MATWKKIIVSGSDISQLNNDSGYLVSTNTIDSASVAARATTLSPEATSSFSLVAGLARSVSANSVTLGIDTTGSYVANLGSGTGITIGSNTGEGSNPTLAVNYGSSSNTSVQGNTTITINGTSNEVEVTGIAAQSLGGAPSYNIGLPNDVTITQDLTVTRDLTVSRNLTVQGTASFQNTTDLDIADRFIRLASGSNSAGEGGFVVQQGSNGLGEVFGYDQTTTRFGVTSSFDAQLNVFTPDAYFPNVVEGIADDPNAVVSKYIKKGNTFIANNGDIYIYS